MPTTTGAGSTIAICATLPSAETEAGYSALTFTEIGQVEKIGTLGAVYAKTEFQPLFGPKQKYKGSADYGALTPSLAHDESDPGQAILRVAADSPDLFAFRVVYPSGAKRFFQGRVFGYPETVDGADALLTVTPTVEINTKIVKVAALGAVVLPTVTLSGALSKSEGDSGTVAYTYIVTLSQAAPVGGTAVPWALAYGSTDANDFAAGQATSGTLTIAQGQLSGTVTISVKGDTSLEGDETFTFLISTPAGYIAGAATSATGTILNDDAPPAPVFTQQPSISPTSGTAGTTTFAATDGVATNATSISRRWLLGTTSIGTGTTVVAPTSGSLTLENTAAGPGGSKTVTSTAVTVAAPTVTPSVMISSAQSKSEGNSGTTTFTYTVTRSASDGAVSVPWSFTAGSTSPSDFVGGIYPAGGNVTMADGVLSGTFTVNVAGDTTVESDETFTVLISTPGGYVAGASTSATGTILNDDAPAATIMFAGSSTPQKYFDTYTGPANSNVTVSDRTQAGTAFSALGTTGAGATNFGDTLNTLLAKPIRLVAQGTGGTRAADWEADTNGIRTAAVNAAKAAGGVDAVVLIVGFNDAYQSGGSVTSQASHEALLRSLISKMRSEMGQPNVPFIIGVSQIYTGSDSQAGLDVGFTWVRAAEMNVASDTNNYFGAHSYDLAQVDGIHQTSAAYPIHANRLAYNVAAALTGGTVAKGPTPTAVTAVYTTRSKVTLQHSTGTDFSPTSGLSGLQLSFDNFSTLASITAVTRLSATEVQITHGASGGAAPAVRWFYGKAPSISAVLKDNSPRTLPLNPTKTPLVASAGTSATDPALSPFTKTAQVNFRASNGANASPATTNPTGWNAFDALIEATGTGPADSTLVTHALNAPDGNATGWTLTATERSLAANNQSIAAVTNPPYPDDVMNSFWFNGTSTQSNAARPSTLHTLTGLNPAKKYTLDFHAYRSGGTARTTTYSSGGKSATQVNTSNHAPDSLTDLTPDSNGTLTYTYVPAGTGTYGYLGSLVVKEQA